MKKTLFTLITLLTLIFTNCADDDWKKNGTGSNGNGFTLSYTISDLTSVITKSSIDVEEGEDQVNSFYILFFENSTGGTGRFVDAIDVMGSYDVSLGTSAELDITFPEGSSLDNSKEYKLLLCANIKDYLEISGVEDLKTLCDGEKENDVLALLMRISGVAPGLAPEVEQSDNSHRMPMDNLPMGATVVKKANEIVIDVELTRVVTRFDVFCEAEGYELCSASIWNAYAASFIWEGSFTDFTQPRTERYYGVEVNANKEIVGSLYAFENYVSSPSQKDKVTTCLIIGLKNLGSGKVEYFRTNVNVSGITGHQLKRNNVYRTVVRSVNNTGDETERGAYENGELLLDIDISNWLVDDSGIIQIEGQNVLAIPTSDIRLFSQGDKREYCVYTIGNGVPVIESTHLPGHMSASLKLAPGYHENLNFKASILTLEATSGTTDKSENYYVEITFGTMKAPISIIQEGVAGDYVNLSTYELPAFPSQGGEESEEIIITSSDRWSAEIAYGDYFSFSPDVLEKEMYGYSESGFSIYTLQDNPFQETRYCFVKVYLTDKPGVSYIVVLQQEAWDGKYLTVSPKSVPFVLAAGGSSDPITIEASGDWSATVTTEGNDAGFNGNLLLKTIDGVGNGDFTIVFPELTSENVIPQAVVTVKLKNTQLEESIIVYQASISEYGILVCTNTYGVGTLAIAASGSDKQHHDYYVYNLGLNMRNTSLFGSQVDSKVYVPGGFQFIKQGFNNEMIERASIFQATSYPDANEIARVKAVMATDDKKFLIFSHRTTAIDNTLKNFGMSSGYTIKSISSSNTKKAYTINQDYITHPLVQYLVKDGPFTINTGALNTANIILSSRGNETTRGLSDWPSTFVPVIMNSGTGYCVFGFDLTHRFVWISDPAIFGSNTSGSNYLNYNNYLNNNSENVAFLNNFISFLAEVTQFGSSFLDRFR